MIVNTRVRDCLFLNWALSAEAVPPPPRPLRLERHAWGGREIVFLSAVLFHQESLRSTRLPFLKLGYPQVNLRCHVLDDEGVPSVWFRRMWMPFWVAPGWRWLAQCPAEKAKLVIPRPSLQGPDSAPWRWEVRAVGALDVVAEIGSPPACEGPDLGSFDAVVSHFRDRRRAYASGPRGLERIESAKPEATAVWPLRARVEDASLLDHSLLEGHTGHWPALHSAWLCPDVPLTFALGLAPQLAPAVPASQGICCRDMAPPA